jgi:rRNA maturation endonuclease Nob1
MKYCENCKKNYDETNVNIPSPLPDGICAYCGSELSVEEIQALIEEFNASQQNEI